MKPTISKNLFDYATSELSQDAFLCWLAANWDSEDKAIHDSVHDLLLHCIQTAYGDDTDERAETSQKEIQVLDIQRQRRHVDVYLRLRYGDQYYAVIIEDKTRSSYHDNQLNRYYEELSLSTSDMIIGLYFKPNFVPERKEIENGEKRYVVMDYHDILNCLKPGSKNAIFRSYRDRLQKRAKRAQEFKSKNVQEWDDDQFCAFFEYTLSNLSKESEVWVGSFGRNDNKNGGRYSMWLGNQRELGPNHDSFHLNLETANKNTKGPEDLQTCRIIVRWNGNETHERRSRRDFDLSQIGRACRSTKSRFTIMGELFNTVSDRDSNSQKLTDAELTVKIHDAITTYQQWCEANVSK
jgi:hypothetical protein